MSNYGKCFHSDTKPARFLIFNLYLLQCTTVEPNADVCSIAQDILRSKVVKASKLYYYSKKDLKKILLELGITDYKGNSYKKMGEIIIATVKEKCKGNCLIFLKKY